MSSPGILRNFAASAMLLAAPADAALWNTAYYAGWVQNHLPGLIAQLQHPLFISFDNPAACRAKADFATRQGLGGVMIFELGGGYRPGEPAGVCDPLLQAVKEAVRGYFRITRVHHGAAGIEITFGSVIGQDYRIEASDSPAAPVWTVVARTTAADLTTTLTVPSTPDQTRRFFRVVEDRNPDPSIPIP
ncbi:MAG: hypothetical protein MUF04_05210 [Akkermansiaceae bacterium]|jgi:hypothetical protein|nr:hypothetical protein [Akkermansiaceae bacterium]